MHLLRVGFDSSCRDEVPKQFSGWHAEDTLVWVQLDLILVEGGEDLAEVGDEGVLLAGGDDDVVDVDLDDLPDEPFEACLHCALVRGTSVLQPEGHCLVAENAVGCDECCLLLIVDVQSDLLVT